MYLKHICTQQIALSAVRENDLFYNMSNQDHF